MPQEALQAKLAVLRPAGRMTAAVLYGSEDLRIEQVDVPAVAPDEVLLRVRLALTDGTDLKVWKRGYHARMIQPPAIFGHEAVGEIVSVGSEAASRWQPGMRVVPANSAPCRNCYYCLRSQENLCADLLFNNGAYAEYMRVPGRIVRENMLQVADHVSDVDAAFLEPLACVLRGVHERMPRRPVHPGPPRKWWERIVDMLKDVRTWTTLGYFVLMLPLGIAYFVIAVTGLSVGLSLIVGPFVEALGALGWIPVDASIDLDGGVLGWIESPVGLVLAFVAGILIVTLLMHVARAIGFLHARLAKALLVTAL